jgi:type I restriction enzyme S subunit
LRLRKEVVHPRDKPTGAAVFVGLEHIQSLTGVRTGSLPVEMANLTGRKPRFYKGDIVYGYLRPYLNKVWIAEFDGLCSVDQYVYSVLPDAADTEFVASFMRSPIYLEGAPINTSPGQLPRIRTDEVASVKIGLPSLPEQRRVLAALREQTGETERASQALRVQLDAINRLPAALLRRAFKGAN